MTDILNALHFRDDTAARKLIEGIRWPDGTVCPYCGTLGHAYALKKAGWYRCGSKECRKDFTVTMGTVMERSHIPLHKWLIAFYLMNSSKKGISSHQLHRMLDIKYQSAWFMTHRIREAMRSGGLAPMGGGGKVVEADEIFFGRPEVPHISKQRRGRPYKNRRRADRPIVALVERGGSVRTFHVPVADQANVQAICKENIARESRLHTDESKLYFGSDKHFAAHETVKHTADEFVRGDVTTNTVERLFLNLQTRHAGHLSALRREALTPLSRGI
jgi:transposase-like protein